MSTLQSASPSLLLQPAKPGETARFPTATQFFLVLLCYFSAHLVARTLVSEVAGIDEGDQLVLGQKWSWGYGPQPPLYTWLLMFFTRVFGPSIFSLTLLREMMLFGIYALTYFNARALTRSHAGGLAAAVALQFSPSIVWESQRELTHSILASLMVLATLFAFLKLRPKGWAAYLAFGICGGLAVLSKYNAALFYAGLLLAGLSLSELRARLLNWRMAAAIGLSLLLLAPNLWWEWTHWKLASASLYKFGVHEAMPWTVAVRTGLLHWFESAGAHIMPLLIMFAIVFRGPAMAGSGAEWQAVAPARLHTDEERALWRTLLFMCGMAVLSVFCLKVTNFKDRWLQPTFVSLPILLVAVWRDGLNRPRLRTMLWLGALVGAVVLVMAPVRVLLTERLNKREILNAPFRRLAPDLAPLMNRSDFVVCADRWLAGNLHLWFPDKLVISPDLMTFYHPSGRQCLLVWELNQRAEPPPVLLEFGRSFSGGNIEGQPAYVEEVLKYHRSRQLRLGAIMVVKMPDTPENR